MVDDPEELVDLSDKAESAIAIRRLLGQLRATQAKLRDPLELPESFACGIKPLQTSK
jgi:hypothetical protein